MTITSQTPVRDIAVQFPTAIPVLERLGVDYCCHGGHTLAEACSKKNITLEPVLEELKQFQQRGEKSSDAQWATAPLKTLTEHIVSKHHAFTRTQLQLIDELMTKVEHRHGPEHPQVYELGKAIAVFASELKHHAECEEANLFPYIAAIGSAKLPNLPAPAKGSVEMPIKHMMGDHDQTGEELAGFRKMTDNYTPPPEACPTWRALYRAIEDLENDLHQHIHLENNILFPRAIQESQVGAAAAAHA